jgi:hypothetical protein
MLRRLLERYHAIPAQHSFLLMGIRYCVVRFVFELQLSETRMKTYKWLGLSAAIVITVLEGMLFTSRIGSRNERRAAVAAPEVHAATTLASKPTGRNSPSKS